MLFIPAITLFLGLASGLPHRPTKKDSSTQTHWNGFSSIENLFTFGGSYDATLIETSNGPNWVDLLTTTFSQSRINSFDFALPGATTDSSTVNPGFELIPTIKTQVELGFLPLWSPLFALDPTLSDKSLFVLLAFPGNDILGTFKEGTLDTISIPNIFETYKTLVEELYKAGARNFVFNNLPDGRVLPLIMEADPAGQKQVSDACKLWNVYVDKLTAESRSKYSDVTIFEPDMYTLFNEVSANPKSHPETAGITNTTGYCETYALMIGTIQNPDAYAPECGVPANQYLFLDALHPQSPMHKAIARTMFETFTS